MRIGSGHTEMKCNLKLLKQLEGGDDESDSDLDAARPLLHEAVDADLEELVVPERPVRHDDAVVELVVRPPPLGRPVVFQTQNQDF